MARPEFPSFAKFYSVVNDGQAPFPWQERLVDQVVARGWPDTIGLPTGMGKTACIDVAVWALAHSSHFQHAQRSAPTRTWYVVNRRLLVDAAFDHGRHLASMLADPKAVASADDAEAMHAVSEALGRAAALKTDRGPLHVVRLRGGADIGERPPDPSQPALIFATVPMFASRYLFRGYGASLSMQPVDAALAGMDSVVLLDEAHIARPLMQLVAKAAECDLGDPSSLLPAPRDRARVVALTATGEREGVRFDLDHADRNDAILRRRLTAPKPATLVPTTRKELARTLASKAGELVETRPRSACVVFCNSVRTAREVWELVDRAFKQRGRPEPPVLVTGRMRDREAEAVRRRVLDPVAGAPSRRPSEPTSGTERVVVCTQTLEVGADLDFDFLVTETAGVRALTQRFGRVNRLGMRPHAAAAICHPQDAHDGGLYRAEPKAIWARLEAVPEPIDMSLNTIDDVLGPPDDIPERAGELLSEHLWEFAKTSIREPDEAPLEVFFDDLDEHSKDVSVCWRIVIPRDGTRLVPAIREAEAVEVPIWELRDALKGGITKVARLAADRASLESVDLDRLRPGDTVVLSVDKGRYDQHGWNPSSTEPVLDVSVLDSGLFWLTREAIRHLCQVDEEEMAGVLGRLESLNSDEDRDIEDDRDDLNSLRDVLRGADPHLWITDEEWSRYLELVDWGRIVRDDQEHPYLVGSKRSKPAATRIRADSFEELSFDAIDVKSPGLRDHLQTVAQVATRIARAVGLPEPMVATLGLAGRCHDGGKTDPRFQRWLDPDGIAPEALAKSTMTRDRIDGLRVASGWPRGGRHELLSVRLLERWLADHPVAAGDAQLALHLVAAHHGYGRPWLPVVRDLYPMAVRAGVEGSSTTVSGDLAEPDWAQPRRFRACCEQYGVWGLALLDAILRQSDHVASGQVEVV